MIDSTDLGKPIAHPPIRQLADKLPTHNRECVGWLLRQPAEMMGSVDIFKIRILFEIYVLKDIS